MAGNQGTFINTITFPELVDLTNHIFYQEGHSILTGKAQQLFQYSNEQANTGNTRRFDAIDSERFANTKAEGADAKKAKIGIGYYKVATAKRVAKEVDITWEMRRYNKEPELLRKLVSLAEFCPNRMELDLTHRFTFATSTSYTDMDGLTVSTTCGDGYALAYSAHELPFSSMTYRNRVSGDPLLSSGGLEAAEELAATNLYSDFGEKISMEFKYLVVGDSPTTRNEARRLLNSTSDYDYNNSGAFNNYNGKYILVELPYLATTALAASDSTKKNWWALVSPEWQAYFGVWEMPNLKTPDEDTHNDNVTMGARASYAVETPGSKGVIISCPST